MVAGVFNLSAYSTKVPNHMVGIGGLPNTNGLFEDCIIASSDRDKDRLRYFTVDHLNEMVVVYLRKK